jgi:hypothetical protein
MTKSKGISFWELIWFGAGICLGIEEQRGGYVPGPWWEIIVGLILALLFSKIISHLIVSLVDLVFPKSNGWS